uniref:TRAP transporter small permease n=1 Tax=Fervidicoccus fontis TaxID=683846 RepID=A0A7J3ZJ38_9CREN
MKALIRAINTISEAVGKLSIALLLVALVSILYGIFARTVLDRSAFWQIPLAIYVTLAMAYLAAGYGQKHGVHVAVHALLNRLPVRVRGYVRIATTLLAILTFTVMGWKTLEYTVEVYRKGWITYGMFEVPLWLLYLSIAAGLFLLVAQMVVDLIVQLKRPE